VFYFLSHNHLNLGRFMRHSVLDEQLCISGNIHGFLRYSDSE